MPPLPKYENLSIKQEELVDKVSENMGVPIYFDGGDRAFYSPSEDAIHVPEPSCFESSYAYNSTVMHELAHSTGHSSRLNRNLTNVFDSNEYAFEELIAEITSCFMSAEFNGEESISKSHMDNHKAYIKSWINAIKDKPETLINAIKEAQTAAAYMEYTAELIDDVEYENIISNMRVRREEMENSENEMELKPTKETGRISVRQRMTHIKNELPTYVAAQNRVDIKHKL